ncbi:HIRAN domain-containing protein [Microbacterium sp. B19]|uniref:HIRAN domain-containing protein n=1 Tax=Microbacterium sp. B19 TaxID=96765 RepID=UPI0003B72FA2|nr:HIRAN domain-containing protein [Microbacterium sp. B19]
MGILQRLFGPKQPPAEQVHIPTALDWSSAVPDLVKLSGTTTIGKEAIAALAQRSDPDDSGYIEAVGSLQREPNNPVDPHAVAVFAQAERIGYLPGHVAKALELSPQGSRPVRLQIFTQLLEKGLRAEAWCWLGEGAPVWQWSEQNRPPLSVSAKRSAEHRERHRLVREALAEGGKRAEQFKAGSVDGLHYLQAVEPIKQLKREGRLDEALALCYVAIEGAERAARREKTSPPPFYTEQAAIVHRKLGQRDEEIAVLRRYVAACPPQHRETSLKARLEKLLG